MVNKLTELAEFGMDSMNILEIKSKLEREFKIYLNNDEIKKLNFDRIYEMEKEFDQGLLKNTNYDNGNQILFLILLKLSTLLPFIRM